MRYFFAPTGENLGAFDDGSLHLLPEGSIEVDRPYHGLSRMVNGVVVEHVDTAEELLKVFEAQDEDIQADFAPLFVAVDQHLKTGKKAIAKKIIQRASIPQELEPIRQELLNKFN